MRIILFFDLPRNTSREVSQATKFVKNLTKEGFLMLQESVYCKLLLNMSAFEGIRKRIDKIKPAKGNIMMMTVTEKQFNDIEYVLGESNHKQYDKTDRMVVV